MTETVFPSTTVATSNQTSNYVPNNGNNVSLWVKGASLNAADSTIKLQGSNKPSTTSTDWVDMDESIITIAATATAYGSGVLACPYAYVRAVYTKNTNSAGTIEAIINFQR